MNRYSLAFLTLFAAGTVFAGSPTIDQVYQAASSGRLNDADQMMVQVLKDHPDSAKAHYVDAEILTREGKLAQARTELATAERLAPGLPFAKTGAVNELHQVLGNRQAAGNPGTVSYTGASGGIPWGTLIIGFGLLAIVISLFRAMTRPHEIITTSYPPAGNGPTGYGYGGGPYAPQPGPGGPVIVNGSGGFGGGGFGGGLGGGLMGSLATGAAVGAGVVAGETLMHKVLDDHPSSGNVNTLNDAGAYQDNSGFDTSRYDMGGNDFGLSDSSSWDDGNNSGGDGW